MTETVEEQFVADADIVVAKFQVTGVSSLLMNNPQKMARPATSGRVSKIPEPLEEAQQSLYRDEEGTLYLPSIAFRNAFLKAAGMHKIKRYSGKTIAASSVFNVDSRTPLIHPQTGERLTDQWRIHTVRAVVQSSGVMRSRPELPEWAALVNFEVITADMQPVILEQWFNEAGRVAGVGDWRPEKTGPHGRFIAELVGIEEV